MVRRGSTGYVALGVALAVTAVGLVALLGQGNRDRLVRFRNGGLFVHSSAKRQLHHVDLGSGKVDFALPLDAGAYDIVNTGGVTVARNRQTGAGTVIDLSEASGKASRALLLDSGTDLVAGGGQVFALDRPAGTVTPIDTTGATPGAPARTDGPIEGTAAVDGDGRLWAPVPSRGAIVPIDAQRQSGRVVGAAGAPANLAPAGAALDVTVFNGSALGVVRRTDTTVIYRLAPGAATRPLSYPGPLEFAAVQGEATGNHLAGLDRARGEVIRIHVDTGSTVPVSLPGRSVQELGPPLQAGNKLIVPDPQRGEVLVIDADRPGTQSVVAVAERAGPLDVQVKDGAVVINAPDGSKAVEVDREGNVQTIDKYLPVPAPADASADPPPPSPRPQPVDRSAGSGQGPGALVTVAPRALGPPVNLAATAGRSQVSLAWQPPVSGAATGYVVSGPRGDAQLPAGTLTATLPADDEVPVVFRIRAVNPSGSSAAASFPGVTPHSQVPGAVGPVRAAPQNGKIDLSWSAAPANGTTIDRYVITGSDGSTTATTTATTTAGAGPATTATVEKLVNGTAYTFTVRAVATNGAAGDASAPSPAAVPFGPPTPPGGFSVDARSGGLRAQFAPSQSEGNGRPVARYEVVAAAGTSATPPPGSTPVAGTTSPIDVGNLTNATPYAAWVRTVTTDAGPGPWSQPRNVTPAGVPTLTLTKAARTGEREITGTFTVSDNGAPSRCVLVVNGSETAGGCTSITVGGLAFSTKYTVHAYAVNAFGRSPDSTKIPVSTCDRTDTAVGIARTRTGGGYWRVDARGAVSCFGDAVFSGSAAGQRLNSPVVGMAADPKGTGYWLVAGDGGVFTYGSQFKGSEGDQRLNAPVVGMAASPSGGGYWLAAGDGGVFAFGDAPSLLNGSLAGKPLSAPVVGIAATPTGRGYWLAGGDGGVFAFGDAAYRGSLPDRGIRPNRPVVGVAATTATGYWLVAGDGGVFAFGGAGYPPKGSLPDQGITPNQPVVAMAATPAGDGYWLVAGDGGVFAIGGAEFHGR